MTIDNFNWVKKDNWADWEPVLYTLVWMRTVLIEENLTFSEDLWEEYHFPAVPAPRQSPKLECVVQLIRHPKEIRPRLSEDLQAIIPPFPANTRIHFTASALAHHLRKISKQNKDGWLKYSVDDKQPRVLHIRCEDRGCTPHGRGP